MTDSPWVKFYASDWLAGTSGLTAAERGVYITIIALIYENGGPVSLDMTRLARRCGLPAGSFKRVLEALMTEKKLIETPDGITNERAEKEIGERENLRTKHQSGAQKTNTIRAEKSKENQQQATRTAQRTADAYQKPEAREDTSVSSLTDRFEEFWDVYPHRNGKKGKHPAGLKYRAAVKRGVSEQSIIDGAVRYRTDERVLNGYAKNPETWLNQRCWEDEAGQPHLRAINGDQYDQHRGNTQSGGWRGDAQAEADIFAAAVRNRRPTRANRF